MRHEGDSRPRPPPSRGGEQENRAATPAAATTCAAVQKLALKSPRRLCYGDRWQSNDGYRQRLSGLTQVAKWARPRRPLRRRARFDWRTKRNQQEDGGQEYAPASDIFLSPIFLFPIFLSPIFLFPFLNPGESRDQVGGLPGVPAPPWWRPDASSLPVVPRPRGRGPPGVFPAFVRKPDAR